MPGLLFFGCLSPRRPPTAAFGGGFWGYAFTSALSAARGGFSTPQRNGVGCGAPTRAKHHPHTLLNPARPRAPRYPFGATASPLPWERKGGRSGAGLVLVSRRLERAVATMKASHMKTIRLNYVQSQQTS